MSTLVQLAKEMQGQFTVVTRNSGGSIWVLKDGAPKWMREVMHHVHDDGAYFPDDTVYDLTHDCVNAIAELDENADADEARDAVSEIEVEHRTWQLYTWAAQWSEYIDELIGNFGEATIKSSSDVFDMFQAAQGLHIQHVGEILIDALDSLVEEDEDDEDEPPPPKYYGGKKVCTNTPNAQLNSEGYYGIFGKVLPNSEIFDDERQQWSYMVELNTGDVLRYLESELDDGLDFYDE